MRSLKQNYYYYVLQRKISKLQYIELPGPNYGPEAKLLREFFLVCEQFQVEKFSAVPRP